MHRLPAVPAPIEDYALIGDCQTAALVSRSGSIDWLCLPRFDSGACFAALLGTSDHGRWLLAPAGEVKRVERAYRDGTLVLDTTFHVDGGSVTVTDCMPIRDKVPHVLRVVKGVSGKVRMRTELVARFDYGSIVPWVRKYDHGIIAVAGPDSLHVASEIPLRGEDFKTVGDFDVSPGQTVAMALSWHPSHMTRPANVDVRSRMAAVEREWREWSSKCTYEGPHHGIVMRSLITLKALTLHADRRNHRRSHHVAARAARRGAQLGLSLLLAARRHLHALRAHAKPATSTRPAPGASGCCGPWPATPPRCKSSTPSTAVAASARRSSPGCLATRARRPCASETRPRSRGSWTSTAK